VPGDFVLAVQRCGNAFAISGRRESQRPLNLARLRIEQIGAEYLSVAFTRFGERLT
jgi:hypothetical protein